jgi:hypothetical protein
MLCLEARRQRLSVAISLDLARSLDLVIGPHLFTFCAVVLSLPPLDWQ